MNKTFKVVFNKARGALIAVNEATSSVQKKGTKTVVAATVLSVVCGAAVAANTTISQGVLSWDGEAVVGTAPETGVSVNVGQDGAISISASGVQSARYGVLTNLYLNEEKKTESLSSKGIAITGSTFTGNKSANAGGALTLWQDGSVGSADLTHSITNTTFSGNSAAKKGGALSLMTQTNTAGSTTLTDVTFDQNSADQGGAIYVEGTKLNVNGQSNFTGNKATNYGGAIYLDKAEATITGAVFNGNSVTSNSGRGGAIYLNQSSLNVSNTTFENNSTPGLAGAVFVNDTDATFDNVVFKGNKAGQHGGAIASIFNKTNTVTVKNSQFEGNSGLVGGAMAIYYGVNVENSTFTDNTTGANTDDGGGAIVLGGHAKADISGSTFTRNRANLGGAISTRPANGNDYKEDGHWLHIADSKFVENEATVGEAGSKYTGGSSKMYNGDGGAVWTGFIGWAPEGTQVDSTNWIENSTFTGNKASHNGGAIYNEGQITIRGTNTFSGNTAGNQGGAIYTNANTLTLEATNSTDVISFTQNAAKEGGSDLYIAKHELIGHDKRYSAPVVNLTGAGTISFGGSIAGVAEGTINASAAVVTIADAKNYLGKFNVTGGQTTIDGTNYFGGEVDVNGGTLVVDNAFKTTSTTLTNGVLRTGSANIFKKTDEGESTTFTAETGITYKGGLVEIIDQDYSYTLGDLKALQTALRGTNSTTQVAFINGKLTNASDVTLGDVTDGNLVVANETIKATPDGDGAVTVGTANQSAPIDATVGAISAQGAKGITLTGAIGQTTSLTLAGVGGDLIVGAETDATTTVETNAILNLGHNETSKGNLNTDVTVKGKMAVNAGEFTAGKVKVEAGGTMNVAGNSDLSVGTLTVTGTVNVGNDKSAGRLNVESLAGENGTVFLDPAWSGFTELDVVGNASHLGVSIVDAPISTKLIAGQNSMIALGATTAEAISAVEKIFTASGNSWGENGITAALYVGAPITPTAGILVNGAAGTTAGSSVTAQTVTVAANGLLAVSAVAAPADGALITGKVAFTGDNNVLGILNASEKSFTLATEVSGTVGSVVTDNPFFSANLDGASGTVTTAFDADGGLAAVASTGLQAMTRRADFTMAQTIADRASTDQELQPGMNLWVDLAGETYKSDDLDHGGDFEADVFYGAFGGDVKVADDYTVGAAFQYGTGTLRSGVSNIKNAIDNYGLTLYGTAKYGSAKILGELAYVWGENDITSAQTALNGSVDTTMYSAGVTGMYELQAGGFTFVPSIGVRVSQLETDAMQVGAFKVEDQDQTLVQIPIALRINGADMAAGGWKFAPSFKIAYVPTFGDKEIEVLGHETDVIDTNPVQVDFGLRAGTENLLVNAAFAVGAGHNGTSSVGGKVGIKYAF